MAGGPGGRPRHGHARGRAAPAWGAAPPGRGCWPRRLAHWPGSRHRRLGRRRRRSTTARRPARAQPFGGVGPRQAPWSLGRKLPGQGRLRRTCTQCQGFRRNLSSHLGIGGSGCEGGRGAQGGRKKTRAQGRKNEKTRGQISRPALFSSAGQAPCAVPANVQREAGALATGACGQGRGEGRRAAPRKLSSCVFAAAQPRECVKARRQASSSSFLLSTLRHRRGVGTA